MEADVTCCKWNHVRPCATIVGAEDMCACGCTAADERCHVPVLWLNFNEDAPNRGYWDQGLLEDLFAGNLSRPPGWPEFFHYDTPEDVDRWAGTWGAIVVVPGRQNAEYADKVQDAINAFGWVILIITGDEENTFPLAQISHSNMRTWAMTPCLATKADVYLGSGYPTGMRQAMNPTAPKTQDWFFSGQITHDRREKLMDVLVGLERDGSRGTALPQVGFTQGLPQDEYWRQMESAWMAPCPGGPVSPDSFRLFEALEAGCVPVADKHSGRNTPGEDVYWNRVFGDHPFPSVKWWADFEFLLQINYHLEPMRSAKIGAWWLEYKRRLAFILLEQIRAMSELTDPGGDITVLVPTSIIPSHPDTGMLETVVGSVRKQLPEAEILLMFDGVRGEQGQRQADYEEYVRRAVRLCNSEWTNVRPIIFDTHHHQGAMTRKVLKQVETPFILFVEHDAPIDGDIPWEGLKGAITSGDANVIRLHHEASILAPHQYLMLSVGPEDHGVPLTPTIQWSQRPHLASTEWYRWMVNEYFGEGSRTMIEDVMYGVLETTHREEGREGWERFRLYIYTPEGDIKRSWHLDGRGDDPKYSMRFDYDGREPKWAPWAGVRE